jgi:hypothetical protein
MARSTLTKRRSFMDLLRGTRGAIDLASIMVGVLVIGIVGGVIAATVFAVIPWSQDKAAAQSLGAVQTAEAAHYGLSTDKGRSAYATMDQLVAQKLIQDSKRVAAVVGANDRCYVATSLSDTGIQFWTDSTIAPDIRKYTASSVSTCATIPELAVPGDGDAPGGTTPGGGLTDTEKAMSIPVTYSPADGFIAFQGDVNAGAEPFLSGAPCMATGNVPDDYWDTYDPKIVSATAYIGGVAHTMDPAAWWGNDYDVVFSYGPQEALAIGSMLTDDAGAPKFSVGDNSPAVLHSFFRDSFIKYTKAGCDKPNIVHLTTGANNPIEWGAPYTDVLLTEGVGRGAQISSSGYADYSEFYTSVPALSSVAWGANENEFAIADAVAYIGDDKVRIDSSEWKFSSTSSSAGSYIRLNYVGTSGIGGGTAAEMKRFLDDGAVQFTVPDDYSHPGAKNTLWFDVDKDGNVGGPSTPTAPETPGTPTTPTTGVSSPNDVDTTKRTVRGVNYRVDAATGIVSMYSIQGVGGTGNVKNIINLGGLPTTASDANFPGGSTWTGTLASSSLTIDGVTMKGSSDNEPYRDAEPCGFIVCKPADAGTVTAHWDSAGTLRQLYIGHQSFDFGSAGFSADDVEFFVSDQAAVFSFKLTTGQTGSFTTMQATWPY